MDKLLQDTLVLLGLSIKEIKFFHASFKLGQAPINEILKLAKLERSTGYLVAQELLEKGLIEEDFKHYRKTIIPAEPKKLVRMLANKQRQMHRQELEMQENLAELQAVYIASEIRPKVRVFEGNKGLLAVWEDLLSIKQELLLWTNQETESLIFSKDFHKKFISERIKKQITMRVLAVNNKKGENLIKYDNESLRATKILPKPTLFSAETYIYGNKIAILDYKKDVFGIIIESEQVMLAQRAIFEMTWTSGGTS